MSYVMGGMIKRKKIFDRHGKWNNINRMDYLVFCLAAFCTFVLFAQSDAIITGNNGMLLLEGNPFKFYTRSYEFWGEYGANYLPSTFVAYAFWNIPIKLFGATAHRIEDTPLWQIYWYKMLPCIVFVLCIGLVCQLCRQLKFGEDKTRFVTYAFMTAPFAFFSQFIFCQYDVFTVFFLLLGLRLYFGDISLWKNKVLFSLCFGMAFTFKYHAVLFFLVLLFLKVKEIPKAIGCCLVSGVPAIVEIMFFYIFDKDAFWNAVFGFSALEYASGTGIPISFSSVNLMVLCTCLLLAWSYFTNPQTERELVCDSFFFCSGICVVLFGLMAWHPQWLLLGVVFWTFCACLNKHCDTFFWLDMLGIAVFYCLTVIKFAGNVDQTMLSKGILRKWLYQKELSEAVSMKDVLHITDVDDGLLYSVFLAILIVQFVFSHRKYCQQETGDHAGNVWLLRLRLWCGVLLFVVPALLCLPDMVRQKSMLQDDYANLSCGFILDLKNREVVQKVPFEGGSISKVQIFTGTFGKTLKETTLLLEIREQETGAVTAQAMAVNEEIMENAYTDFLFGEVELRKECGYEFVIKTIVSSADEEVTVFYYNEEDWNKEDRGDFEIRMGEEEMKSCLMMKVVGELR